jgi:PII-like signaling protein
MLKPGPARKVTIYVNEDTASRNDYLHSEVFAFLLDREVSGATLIRPEAGFGSRHRTHSTHAFGAEGLHLPIRIEFIESAGRVAELLPLLSDLVRDGIIEVQETTIFKVGSVEAQV